jgi:hypothetical protein
MTRGTGIEFKLIFLNIQANFGKYGKSLKSGSVIPETSSGQALKRKT